MALNGFSKQPYEEFVIAGDFADVLETGETLDLSSSSVSATDKDGNDVSLTILEQATVVIEGSQLKVRCMAGESDLSPYKVTFRTSTNLTNKWEIDIKLQVKEL